MQTWIMTEDIRFYSAIVVHGARIGLRLFLTYIVKEAI